MQAIAVIAPQQIMQRTIPTLERQLDDAAAGKPGAVDLVLKPLQMIDSAGLNWLLGMQTRLETMGTTLRLVDPSAVMVDVLIATRLDVRFKVQHTEAGGSDGRG